MALFETYFKANSIAIMFMPVKNIYLLLTKFICGLVLHLALFEEFSRALDLMKFALNHKDVFESFGAAWGVACMQASVTFSVELLNVMVILMSENVSDVVLNFVAFAIISDFDNFIYNGGIREEV